MKNLKPPPYRPIEPINVSSRWFPKGASFGLYRRGSTVAPNVTSILSSFFPFDKRAWMLAEPDIDHDAVSAESAARGTAVHLAMEQWLTTASKIYPCQYAAWVEPLRGLVSKASATLAVEIPVFYELDGIGSYAGSADALMLVGASVVLIDYKTKRENKRVHERYLLKQKLQMAAYAMAINQNYKEQLPGAVERASLLFAHPDPGKKPTVVKVESGELQSLSAQFKQLLKQWHENNREALSKIKTQDLNPAF